MRARRRHVATVETLAEQAAVFADWIVREACTARVQKLARQIVARVPRDAPAEADALEVALWVDEAVRYTTVLGETMPESVHVLVEELGAGDCDNRTVAIAALLLALGWQVALVFGVDHAGRPFHVWPRVEAVGRSVPLDLDTTPGVTLGASPVGTGDVAGELVFPVAVDLNQPCCESCADRARGPADIRGARPTGFNLMPSGEGVFDALGGSSGACPEDVETAQLAELIACVETDKGISEASREAAFEIGARVASDPQVAVAMAEQGLCHILEILASWPFNLDIPDTGCGSVALTPLERLELAQAGTAAMGAALGRAYLGLMQGAYVFAAEEAEAVMKAADELAGAEILPREEPSSHTEPIPYPVPGAFPVVLSVPHVEVEGGDAGGAWTDWYRSQAVAIWAAVQHVCGYADLKMLWYEAGAHQWQAFETRETPAAWASWPATKLMLDRFWDKLEAGHYKAVCPLDTFWTRDYTTPQKPGLELLKLEPKLKVTALPKWGTTDGGNVVVSSSSDAAVESGGGAGEALAGAAFIFILLRMMGA